MPIPVKKINTYDKLQPTIFDEDIFLIVSDSQTYNVTGSVLVNYIKNHPEIDALYINQQEFIDFKQTINKIDNTPDREKIVLSATKLTTGKKVNGTLFDGTKDMTTEKWGQARLLSLTGDVKGSVSLDGESDTILNVTVIDDSHNHTDCTLPSASSSVSGLTKLTNSITSISTDTAATPNSVKLVYDKVNEINTTLTESIKTEQTRAEKMESAIQNTLNIQKPIWDDKYTKNEIDNKLSSYDDTNAKKHTHSNKTVLDGITSTLITAWNNAANTSDCITPTERTLWNTVSNKVDKISGKGLSTNDYTDTDKSELSALTDEIEEHTKNNSTHIASTERNTWNAKLGKTDSLSENTVHYTESSVLSELSSGEKMSVAYGKLTSAVKNVIANVKLLGTTDISAIGDGTVTGAVSALNSNLPPIKYHWFIGEKTGDNGLIYLATLNSTLGEDTLAYVMSVGLGYINGGIPSGKRLTAKWFVNEHNMLYVEIFDVYANESVPNITVNLLLQFGTA